MQLSDGMAALWVLAAGGGGSSSFGGGGGGGGFSGGGSSGSGGSGEMSPGAFALVAVAVVLFLVAGALLAARKRRRSREAREARSIITQRAAAEAVEDDEHFAVETVLAAARALFMGVQEAWEARDRDRLRGLAGEDLFEEWKLRLDDFAKKGWHNRVQVTHDPDIHYVGLENRGDDAQDTVVVSIECTLEDYVVDDGGTTIYKDGESSAGVRLCEFWTLRWSGDGWRVDSIQSEEEAAGVLDAPLVPSPWSDEGRLRDEALVEGAVADAAPDGSPRAAELVDLDYADDARAAALDLSLVDGRFAPDVLEAAVRGVLPAWVAAVDGADDALLRVATPEAVHELLYPRGDDRVRLVVRAPRLETVRIVELHTDRDPVEMTVSVSYRGRRYLEDRSTAAVVEGSRERETSTVERLVLRLDDGDPEVPWRVVGGAGVRTT
ncbi:MAG: TIM44-like domain-containing protein [Solirubrobacterales bacterium]|nr:TIM44-like domain-containing protein [Solirubrobacterales bacterium]